MHFPSSRTVCTRWLAAAMWLGLAGTVQAQERASDSRTRDIDAVLAHPPFAVPYVCAEHPAGALPSVGDDLGQDCMVQAEKVKNFLA